MFRRLAAGAFAGLVLASGAATATVALTPAPAHAVTVTAAASFPVLERGDDGYAVMILQHALINRGRVVAVDGVFGAETDAAVKKLQSDLGWEVSGVVGKNTWSVLVDYTARGNTGHLVRAIQERLGLPIDGIFGPATESAVKTFQHSRGLTADGIVAAPTWASLMTTSSTSSLVNPYAPAFAGNGEWTARSAWLRDTIAQRFGLECTTYKTSSTTSDHRTGNAMDCWGTRQQMYDLSRWAAANAGSLKVSYVIFEQRIWQVSKASSGWVLMEDRGDRTQNHVDHVHISLQH